jgi:hypothetical protein
MDYIHVDNLSVDQLLEDDLIEIENEIVKVINLDSLKDGYAITFENEFGERDIIELDDNAIVKLFILQ